MNINGNCVKTVASITTGCLSVCCGFIMWCYWVLYCSSKANLWHCTT